MTDRRTFLILGAACVLTAGASRAGATSMSQINAHSFVFKALDGHDIALGAFAGKPILVVNTASHCGYTPQYAGLQSLWSRYRDRGLLVLGVPSNDFGGQEPGGVAEIGRTAGEFHATFPLAAKTMVRGPDAHPFYVWAARQRPLEAPRWNFHKYLIGRDGALKAGFTSAVEPTDNRIVAAIEQELGS